MVINQIEFVMIETQYNMKLKLQQTRAHEKEQSNAEKLNAHQGKNCWIDWHAGDLSSCVCCMVLYIVFETYRIHLCCIGYLDCILCKMSVFIAVLFILIYRPLQRTTIQRDAF
eukprot:105225_1